MATSMTTSFPVPAMPEAVQPGTYRRRRISPQSGRALEILGHAFEYLADEYADEGLAADHAGRLVAIQLLMKVNRAIYFECPEVPRLRDRFFLWMRGRA